MTPGTPEPEPEVTEPMCHGRSIGRASRIVLLAVVATLAAAALRPAVAAGTTRVPDPSRGGALLDVGNDAVNRSGRPDGTVGAPVT